MKNLVNQLRELHGTLWRIFGDQNAAEYACALEAADVLERLCQDRHSGEIAWCREGDCIQDQDPPGSGYCAKHQNQKTGGDAMSWPKMTKVGTVTVTAEGKVYVEGFEFEHASCREACQLGMAWAVEKIGAALVEDMTADMPVLSGIG